MKDYAEPASDEELEAAVEACLANGVNAMIADNGSAAKALVLDLVPQQAEVFTMTSVTLDATGISEAINKSGEYESVREKLNRLDPAAHKKEMRRLGAAPD